MEYLLAFQLLCGCFAAFVASRKDRSGVLWFTIGLMVPVFGVVSALAVGKPRHVVPRERKEGKAAAKPRRSLRCCGRYVPDCRGCAYFLKPLFDPSYTGERKGYCAFFHKELVAQSKDSGQGIVIADRKDAERGC